MSFEEVWDEFWEGDGSTDDLLRKIDMTGHDFAEFFFKKGQESVHTQKMKSTGKIRSFPEIKPLTHWPDPRTEK